MTKKIFPKMLDKTLDLCYNIIVPKEEHKIRKEVHKMTKVLREMPYAQAKVITTPDNNIMLQSYSTIVATIDNEGWLTIYGLYSMTTRKHLKAFCKEYCGFDMFNTIKMLANEKMRMNIHTGEILSM
jgi:hypothetical protein